MTKLRGPYTKKNKDKTSEVMPRIPIKPDEVKTKPAIEKYEPGKFNPDRYKVFKAGNDLQGYLMPNIKGRASSNEFLHYPFEYLKIIGDMVLINYFVQDQNGNDTEDHDPNCEEDRIKTAIKQYLKQPTNAQKAFICREAIKKDGSNSNNPDLLLIRTA